MIHLQKTLSRRTLLRGTGAAISLPLLSAMMPSASATSIRGAAPVRRIGYVYIPMGFNPAQWTPGGASGALGD